MKILVLSDTHGNLSRVYSVLNSVGSMLDAVIHCGDYVEDVYTLKNKYPDFRYYYVKGNCDYGSSEPADETFVLGGKRFFITHGDKYSVHWNTDRISYKGSELGADICIFGHTHIPLIENYRGMYIMNPGSISRPRGSAGYTYGIVKIEDGLLTPSIVEM